MILSPYSTSQNEWIAVIPIPLTPDNSSKHSCWLWIHDVSCLYPILLPCKDTQLTLLSDVYVSTIDLNHLMLPFEYRSKVTSDKDICCSCVSFVLYVHNNDTPPYQSIPSWNKIYYPHTSVYSTNVRAYTNRYIICIVANRSYHNFVVSML